jgi:hypothetical protein
MATIKKVKNDLDLQSIISSHISAAEADTDINSQRAELMDRYMAEPYGDEVEDKSSGS